MVSGDRGSKAQGSRFRFRVQAQPYPPSTPRSTSEGGRTTTSGRTSPRRSAARSFVVSERVNLSGFSPAFIDIFSPRPEDGSAFSSAAALPFLPKLSGFVVSWFTSRSWRSESGRRPPPGGDAIFMLAFLPLLLLFGDLGTSGRIARADHDAMLFPLLLRDGAFSCSTTGCDAGAGAGTGAFSSETM